MVSKATSLLLSVESMDSETRHWLTMMVFFVGFSCPPQYVGEYCQFANPCHTGPGPRCQNGGSCAVRLSSNAVPSFSCSCPLGFSASLCEIPVPNVCDAAPCRHGGSCIDLVNDFQCVCDLPYTGRHCDQELDPCSPNRCRNQAKCTASSNYMDFACTCPLGFTGRLCDEDIDECLNNPCKQGALCVNKAGSYQCQCPLGAKGDPYIR